MKRHRCSKHPDQLYYPYGGEEWNFCLKCRIEKLEKLNGMYEARTKNTAMPGMVGIDTNELFHVMKPLLRIPFEADQRPEVDKRTYFPEFRLGDFRNYYCEDLRLMLTYRDVRFLVEYGYELSFMEGYEEGRQIISGLQSGEISLFDFDTKKPYFNVGRIFEKAMKVLNDEFKTDHFGGKKSEQILSLESERSLVFLRPLSKDESDRTEKGKNLFRLYKMYYSRAYYMNCENKFYIYTHKDSFLDMKPLSQDGKASAFGADSTGSSPVEAV